MLRLNAGPGISDLELHHLAGQADEKPDLAMLGEFQRVGEQIDEDLPQPRLIGGHALRQVGGMLDTEMDAFGRRLHTEHAGNLVKELRKADFLALDFNASRLDFGNIHQPLDEPLQMLTTAADDADGLAPRLRDGGVQLQQLGIAEHGVQRRAQLVADAHHESGFRQIGGFGDLARAGQLGICLAMRVDLRRAAGASAGFSPPRRRRWISRARTCSQANTPAISIRQKNTRHSAPASALPELWKLFACQYTVSRMMPMVSTESANTNRKRSSTRVHPPAQGRRQAGFQQPGQLHGVARVGLAGVAATGFERAAKRADRRRIDRAESHVRRFKRVAADAALQRPHPRPGAARLSRQIKASFGRNGEQRHGNERSQQRQERRESMRQRVRAAGLREQPDEHRKRHAAGADRVDIKQMGALELDLRPAETAKLHQHQISADRADPGAGQDGIESEDRLDGAIDAKLHQQQGDGNIEHEPDHPPRMAVREPGEEVRPSDGPGIGVGDIDLGLRDGDQQHHRKHRELRARLHPISHAVHDGGLPAALTETPTRSASTAKTEPASIFTMPGSTQPGPALKSAAHQPKRRPGSAGLRKRR